MEDNILQKLYWIILLSFMGIIFIIDRVTPFDISIGVLYALPAVAGVYLVPQKTTFYLLVGLSFFLIFFDYYLSTTVLLDWDVLINRVLSFVVVFATTYFASLYIDSHRKSKEIEKQFALAVEAAPNGILLVNSSGKIVLANQQTEKLFGYSRAELYQMRVDQLVPQPFRGRHAEYREMFLKNPVTRAMGAGRDLFGLRKNGSEIPIEIGLAPLKSGGEVFVLSSIVDISERKKHQDRLRILNGELEHKNSELEQFVYTASHDLMAPIISITGFAEKLRREFLAHSDPKTGKYIERILVNASTMEKLLKDLLSLSRITHGELQIQKTDLYQLLNVCQSNLEVQIKATNAKIVVADYLPTMEAQPNLMLQVFTNLLTNAVKYSRSDTPPNIEIGIQQQQAEHFVLFVKDNGVGIPTEQSGRVFQIFERLHPDMCDGSGIGLAIVKKIVEFHGGKIWFDSEVNQGTTFYMQLPLKQSRQEFANEQHQTILAKH